MINTSSSFVHFVFKIMFSLCLLTTLSCTKKEDPEPVTTQLACLITKSDRGAGNYFTFQYDDNKRLTAIYQHLAAGQVNQEENINTSIERDQNNRIVKLVSDRGNGLGVLFTLEYDSKGRWIKTVITNTPATDYNYTIVAEYNSDGLVAKTTRTSNNGSSSSTSTTNYEYTNGNLIKSTYTSGGSVVTNQFEYYMDKQATWNEVDQLNRYTGGSSSLSKNVLKQVSVPNVPSATTNYSYQYNEKGFATQITAQIEGVTSNFTTNTYTCTQ